MSNAIKPATAPTVADTIIENLEPTPRTMAEVELSEAQRLEQARAAAIAEQAATQARVRQADQIAAHTEAQRTSELRNASAKVQGPATVSPRARLARGDDEEDERDEKEPGKPVAPKPLVKKPRGFA